MAEKDDIIYNDKTDLLYIRFDDKTQAVINKRISEDIVLDMGENDRIVRIEIMDASRHLPLPTYRIRSLERRIPSKMTVLPMAKAV